MEFSEKDKTKILRLKSDIASYYNLQMKKIDDKALAALFFDNGIITGGCISSIFHGEAVKDIDLYAKNAQSILAIKNYILNSKDIIKTSSHYTLDEVIDDKDPKPLITANAITLNNDVQFVHLGDIEQCRSKFDFIHCMPWYDIKKQKLYISKQQFDSIQKKDLIVNRAYFGEVKQLRIDKYLKRGWKWEPKQTTSTASDINTLTTLVTAWVALGTGSPLSAPLATTDLFQKIEDRKSQFTSTYPSDLKIHSIT